MWNAKHLLHLLQVIEKKNKPHIQLDIGSGQMKTFAPEEISAMVLTKMKETAEAYLGKKVTLWLEHEANINSQSLQ